MKGYVGDFWRMAWQCNVTVIIMATALEEHGVSVDCDCVTGD
jgi:protein tyrosine phosphatase